MSANFTFNSILIVFTNSIRLYNYISGTKKWLLNQGSIKLTNENIIYYVIRL